MAKYRLKKAMPNFRAGELFTVHLTPDKIFPQDSDAIYDPRGNYYDSRGNINDFFDWFEKVDEGVEWLHDGVPYYQPTVSSLANKFVPSCTEYWGTAHDEARRRIGICYKSIEACQRFIGFLTAVEVVSHDEGFMKYDKIQGEVWELQRAYLDSEELFTARKIEYEGFHHLGAFYFDTEEHAIASSEKHPKEWGIIMNYDWSKGEDEEDEN